MRFSVLPKLYKSRIILIGGCLLRAVCREVSAMSSPANLRSLLLEFRLLPLLLLVGMFSLSSKVVLEQMLDFMNAMYKGWQQAQ